MQSAIIRNGKEHGVWICFISLMELFYIIQQMVGVEEARQSYSRLKQLPLMVMESNEELGRIAAGIKAT